MPAQDITPTREKIVRFLRTRGPSLPVHIAKETGLSILFAGAFLSELLAEKEIKISDFKVGSSPVYFLKGQEHLLSKFTNHLNSKEREAHDLLKENKFLEDKSQHPAIRVALRSLKDFAIPFEKDKELYWRYHTASEDEIKVEEKIIIEKPEQQPITKTIDKETSPDRVTMTFNTKSPKENELDIFDQKQEKKQNHKKLKPKSPAKKPTKTKVVKTSSKKEEKFFLSVKDFLAKKQIELIDILGFSKSDLILKINDGKEKILYAYNKKKVGESDISKAHKKAQEYNLPYIVLSMGEPNKKLSSFISAIKDLGGIEKL